MGDRWSFEDYAMTGVVVAIVSLIIYGIFALTPAPLPCVEPNREFAVGQRVEWKGEPARVIWQSRRTKRCDAALPERYEIRFFNDGAEIYVPWNELEALQ